MSSAPDQGALERVIEALLFLSPEPLSTMELVEAAETSEQHVAAAIEQLRSRFAPGNSGIVLRELAGGFTFATDPIAEPAAKRLFGRERRATLTQAQAETLAIVAYLQPVSRPEIARIRGVSADWAITALLERDLVEEAGRSDVGATLYRTTGAFLKHFGLRSLDELPAVEQWDPTPQEATELRERLLRAGDARAGASPTGAAEAGAAEQDAQLPELGAPKQQAEGRYDVRTDGQQGQWPGSRLQPSGTEQPLEPAIGKLPAPMGAGTAASGQAQSQHRSETEDEAQPAEQDVQEIDDEAAGTGEGSVLPLNRWERELLAE